MGHFSEEYHKFFKGLARNNKKEWFDKNRKIYDHYVKAPFYAFVEEMIVRIHADNPDVLINAKEAIFRINRDIRFSKDKTPYKTHMAALISPGGRKARDTPGFYFQFGYSGIRIYSGVHQVQKEKLYQIRSHLAENLSAFDKIINNKEFRNHFNNVLGEKNKRLPVEFQDILEKQPLIANKDFYVLADLKSNYIVESDLGDILMDYYYTAKPLLSFFAIALNS